MEDTNNNTPAKPDPGNSIHKGLTNKERGKIEPEIFLHHEEKKKPENKIGEVISYMIKNKEEFNDELEYTEASIISDYLNNKLSPEADAEVEEYLKETGQHEFYKKEKSDEIILEYLPYVDIEGKLCYDGDNKEWQDIVRSILSIVPNPELSKQVEKYAESYVTRSLSSYYKIESPYNDETCIDTRLVFKFNYEREAELSGFKIHIFDNDENKKIEVKVEKAITQVDLTKLTPGRYYWKLIDRNGYLQEVRRFYLLSNPYKNKLFQK